MLVAELLYSIANTPAAYGTLPLGYHDDDFSSQDLYSDESLARACITSDASAPLSILHSPASPSLTSPSTSNMDFGFDWGGSGGFQTRGKGKKKTTAAPKFSFGDDDEKKDDAGANGAGGDDGLGGSGGGGANGAGGGGDDNNGAGDDDDTWGFSTGGKKNKKKTKKQLEEEEEERKRKEEEEEAQAATANTNALSWADDANDANANEDWTMSWGGAKSKKDKKKTTKVSNLIQPRAMTLTDLPIHRPIFHLLFLMHHPPPQPSKTSASMMVRPSWTLLSITLVTRKNQRPEVVSALGARPGTSARLAKKTRKRKPRTLEVTTLGVLARTRRRPQLPASTSVQTSARQPPTILATMPTRRLSRPSPPMTLGALVA